MASIQFFNQDVSFKLPKPRSAKNWIKKVIHLEKRQSGNLNYIFCSDEYLLEINHKYLNHETFTDIITFDNSEEKGIVEGDIFISIERVKENALLLQTDFMEEVHRVLIHGVLHLTGHRDKSKEEKAIMRKKEDAYLSLRNK
jgi:probable rRNA maturation factor